MTDVRQHITRGQPVGEDSPAIRPVPPINGPPHIGHAPTIGMMLPVRIFLAAGWLRAAAEKVIDRHWWNGSVLRDFLTEQHESALPFFRPVMDRLIAPGAAIVAITVVVTELLCGVLIALGRHLRVAVSWALFLNVTFILAGRVNPSAFYLVMEIMLLFALADGALGSRSSVPSGRTFVVAGATACAASAMVPYVRTVEPALVIDDPAMMLVFLGFVTAATLLVRYASYPHHAHTSLGRLWTRRLGRWLHAKPRAAPAWAPPSTREHSPAFEQLIIAGE